MWEKEYYYFPKIINEAKSYNNEWEIQLWRTEIMRIKFDYILKYLDSVVLIKILVVSISSPMLLFLEYIFKIMVSNNDTN